MPISKLGERVHTLRRRQGLTQVELGKSVDVHSNTLARLERGEIEFLSVDKIIELAQHFDVKLTFLVGMSDSEGTFADNSAVDPAELATIEV